MTFKKGHKYYPHIYTEEMKQNASKRFLGKNNPMYGTHPEVSKETRDKISKANTGNIVTIETRKKISNTLLDNHPARGKTYEEYYGKVKGAEQRKIRSIGIQKSYDLGKREKLVKEKNPAWNDGSSFEPYSSEFTDELKKKIKTRDNFECQKCNIKILNNTKKEFLRKKRK